MACAALALATWVATAVVVSAPAWAPPVAVSVAAAAAYAATIAVEVVALNAVIKAVTPKIRDPGTAMAWQSDPKAGVPYGIGYGPIGGNTIFAQSCGENAKYMNFRSVYSFTQSHQIDYFAVNDVAEPFAADGGEGSSGYYLNRMWLKTQLGAPDEPYLHWVATGSKDTPADHFGNPVEWTSSHKLSGYTATALCLEYDPKRFQAGVPKPSLYAWWAKVYDPRKDSTYPGGVGAQRWNDESTWEWSDNPYCHGLSWVIGRRSDNGVLVLGFGADIEEIDRAAYVAAANIADANAWKANGVIRSDEDRYEILKGILQAGCGLPLIGGALISCFINAPAAAVDTITSDQIIGAMTVPAQVSMLDRVNTVWPTYIEPALGYEQVSPDEPISVPEHVAVDGEQRSVELSYRFVHGGTQVGQLSRYAIEDARELNGVVLTVKPELMWIEPGQCVTIDYPESGFNGQKVRVLKRTLDLTTKFITLYCRTETDGKHAFALGQTTVAPPDPRLTAVDINVVAPPPIGDWGITAGYVAGPGGQLPAIIISGLSNNYDAVQIVVEYREILAGGGFGEWQQQTFPGSATELIVMGVKPGAHYEVRLRYVTSGGVETPTENLPLGDIVVGGIDAITVGGDPVPDMGQLEQDIEQLKQDVIDAQADADAALDYLLDPVNGALIRIDNLEDADATFTSQIGVLQTNDVTLAGRATVLEAKSVSSPNLILNSDASDVPDPATPDVPLRYWSVTPGRVVREYETTAGWRFLAYSGATPAYLLQDVPAAAGNQVTMSVSGGVGGFVGEVGLLYGEWRDAANALIAQAGQAPMTDESYNWDTKRATFTSTVAPAGTAFLRVGVRVNANVPNFGFSRIMVARGIVDKPWNDAKSSSVGLARVTNEEVVRFNNDEALASRSSKVESTIIVLPNLILNSDSSDKPDPLTPTILPNWTVTPAGSYAREYDTGIGWSFAYAPQPGNAYLYQDIATSPGVILTVSLSGGTGGQVGNTAQVYVDWLDASKVLVSSYGGAWLTDLNINWDSKRLTFTTNAAPATAAFARIVVVTPGGKLRYRFSRIMVSYGLPTPQWNDARVAADSRSRIVTEEVTRANNDNALAGRTTTIETSFSRTPNLLLNSDFSEPPPAATPAAIPKWTINGAAVWAKQYDTQIGSYLASTGGAAASAISQDIPFPATGTLSISLVGDPGDAAGALRPIVYVQWLTSTLTFVANSAVLTMDRSNIGWTKVAKLEGLVAPAGTAYARIYIHGYAGGAAFTVGRLMVNYGLYAASWNDNRTASNSLARIQTEEATRASDDGALASRATTLEAVTRAGAPNLLKNSDFSDFDSVNTVPRGWVKTGPNGGIATYVNNYLGPIMTFTTPQSGTGIYQDVPVSAGVSYVLSAEGDSGPHGYCDMQFINAAKDTVLGNTGLRPTSWDTRARATLVSPAGTAYARIYIVCQDTTGQSWARMMVQRGTEPTVWTNQTGQADMVARISTVEAVNTTQNTSIATLTTTVSTAAAQTSTLVANGNFGAYTNATGLPDKWGIWSAGHETLSRQTGQGGNYAVRGSVAAASDYGFLQTLYVTPGKYLLRLEAWCVSGSWAGAGVYTDSGVAINCAADPDLAGVVGAAGPGIRRFSKLVTIGAAGNINIYCMYGWSGFSPVAAKTLDMFVCTIEPMDAVGSQVQVQAGAITTLQGKTSAWWSAQVDAGTSQSFIRAEADGAGGSAVRIGADEVGLYYRAGNAYKVAMVMVGASVRFTGNVQIDGNLTIAGTINTVAVNTNAITTSVAAGGNFNGVTGNNGTVGGALVAQISINCTGGPVLVQGQYSFVCSAGPGNLNSTGDLRRNGATINEAGCYTVRGYKQYMSFCWLDSPPAGVHTYAIYDTVGPGATIAFYAYTLSASELKR